ncbi:MAG TPA: MFS transporter [Acidimicrobiales bacterium]|nr:MFS transporter [Acidimicrobiales bacterium]
MPRIVVDVSPLRRFPHFRTLWTGYLLRAFGQYLTATTVIYQVFVITHSNLDVGLVSLAQLGPALLVPIVGGAISDALDRRKVLVVTAILVGGTTAGLAVNALSPHPALWPLFLCAAIIQGLSSIDSPARSAVVPTLVDQDALVSANVLTQLLWQLSSMVGPGIAGVLIAATHGRVALVYWIDVASTLAALQAVVRLPAMPPGGGGRKFSLGSIAEGFHFLRSRQVIQACFLADWMATVLGEPVSLFPYMALVRFHGGPGAFGLLSAAPAIGAGLGSLLSGWTARVRQYGKAVLFFVVVWGLAIFGFGVSPWLWLGVVFVCLAGWADATQVLFRTTIVQIEVPDRLRGRLFSLQSAAVVSGPNLGNVEGGLVAAASSAQIAITTGGLGCLVGAAAIARFMPALSRWTLKERAEDEGDVGPSPA